MLSRAFVTTALICASAVLPCWQALAESAYTVRELSLGRAPDTDKIRKEFVTRNGHNVVWRVTLPHGECVVLNGKADPVVSAIKSTPVVSADGMRVAYKIDTDSGAKRALIVDGKAGISLDQINNDTIRFSQDGKSIVYSGDRAGATILMRDDQVVASGAVVASDAVFSPGFDRIAFKAALEGGKRAVNLDGQVGPAFLQIDNGSMSFSRDGKHFVYVGHEGEGKNAMVTVVLDGNRGAAHQEVTALTFSPDSNHLAYIAADGGKERVVLDGKEGEEVASVDPYFLRFTSSGKLGYRAEKGDRMTLVLGGEPVGEAQGILDWSSGTGPGAAAIVRSDESSSVLFNSVKGANYDEVFAPATVSPDGKHLAYVARQGEHWFAVKDGMPGGAWDVISQGPVFSADGSHWGFVARRSSRWFVVLDGKENGPYDWFAWGGLQFSPDGKRSAFMARKEAIWAVVLDGKTVAEGEEVVSPARFSADSRHYACMVGTGARWRMVLDGEPGPLFDRLFGVVPEFAADDSLEYPALRDNVLYRVTHKPAGQ